MSKITEPIVCKFDKKQAVIFYTALLSNDHSQAVAHSLTCWYDDSTSSSWNIQHLINKADAIHYYVLVLTLTNTLAHGLAA